MPCTNLTLNGNIYALMESTVKRPKANERWIAVCPMKGDSKWLAKTKEELIARIEEEEGVKAEIFKPKKSLLWASNTEFNGKPVVQWFTDGTMDVDTPSARFRIEMTPVSRGRPTHIIPIVDEDPEEYYEEFCSQLSEHNSGFYFRGVLTKIRLKNPDGTTLRDVEDLNHTYESGCVTPVDLLDSYIGQILDGGSNDLVTMVNCLNNEDEEYLRHGPANFTKEVTLGAQEVFLTIDAMIFLDKNCDLGEGNSGLDCIHINSSISTEDARRALATLQSAVTSLSEIL